jgi:arsenate reductase
MADEIIMYFNPSCSKCLYALEFLKEQGITPTLIEYLSETPSVEGLKSLLHKLKLKPIDIMRTNEPLFIEKFSRKTYSDDEYLEIIANNSSLLQRPILVAEGMAVIGRTDEALQKIVKK